MQPTREVARGNINGRLIVAIVSFMIASVAFVPALLTQRSSSRCLRSPSVLRPLPRRTRHSTRPASTSSIRSCGAAPKAFGLSSRTGSEAIAPIALGALADRRSGSGQRGLQLTTLIILPVLFANGAILALATRSYPHDVASLLASSEEAAQPAG